MVNHRHIFPAFLFIFFSPPLAIAVRYNVLTFGAKPDGVTDSTIAFLKAWSAACDSQNPATIYVPPAGTYLLKSAQFRGPCKNKAITIHIDSTLVAPLDYNVIGNNGNYWLLFERVDGISIRGGTLDGQGNGLWACKKSGKNCPSGATVSTVGRIISIHVLSMILSRLHL